MAQLPPLHFGETPPPDGPAATLDHLTVLQQVAAVIRVQRVDATGWPTFASAWFGSTDPDGSRGRPDTGIAVHHHFEEWTSQLENRPVLGMTVAVVVPARCEVAGMLAQVGGTGGVSVDAWMINDTGPWRTTHFLAPWLMLEPPAIVEGPDPQTPAMRAQGLAMECERRAHYADDRWPYPGQPPIRAWQLRKERDLPLMVG